MAQVTLGGNAIHTVGELPKVGSVAPDFTVVYGDLSEGFVHRASAPSISVLLRLLIL